MAVWITVREFAAVASISRHVASRLLAKIERGEKLYWRGFALQVRCVGGPGFSGKNYIVKVSSLPPYNQERLKASLGLVEGRSLPVIGSDAAHERAWWLHILGPALEHPKGSAERKAALDTIAAVNHLDWHGRRIRISLRTLQRKLARMDGDGNAARSGRADRGKKRVFISRAWDETVPFDGSVKERIAHDLKQEIRGLQKANASWSHTLVLARNKVVRGLEMRAGHSMSPGTSVPPSYTCPLWPRCGKPSAASADVPLSPQ